MKTGDDHSQIGKALHGLDIGDVGHPGSIRGIDIELSGQGIIDRSRWLAAMGTRPAPIAYLGLDSG